MRSGNRRLGVLLVAVLGMVGRGYGAEPAQGGADRCVVMISLDGLAGYYFNDPKAEMPTLRALAAQGARAEGMRAVTPTVTWPNHTTLVTGDNPARHGVVGNNYFDRATDKPVVLIGDPVYDKEQIIHVPTIYDLAKSAGMKTAAIRWPASRNAKSLDWTIPDISDLDLFNRTSTSSLLEECKEAGIRFEDGVEPKNPKRIDLNAEQDERYTQAFNLILRKHRPNMALLHLANIDHAEHRWGPKTPEAYEAIKAADAQVKEVWEELKRDFPGKGTLVIVSDHGFSPIERMILPNVVLREAGLIEVKGMRQVGGAVRVVPQGGAALVYIKEGEDRAAVIEKVKKAFAGVKGVQKVVGPEELAKYGVGDSKQDPHAPDMALFAEMGYCFGDTAGGALAFNEKPEVKGTHGHDPFLPDLHATFIAWGAGIKPGVKLGEIRNTQVAPTVAKVLGVEMKDTDGEALTDVLAQ